MIVDSQILKFRKIEFAKIESPGADFRNLNPKFEKIEFVKIENRGADFRNPNRKLENFRNLVSKIEEPTSKIRTENRKTFET